MVNDLFHNERLPLRRFAMAIVETTAINTLHQHVRTRDDMVGPLDIPSLNVFPLFQGNDYNRNHFNPSNPRYPPRVYPANKPIPSTKPTKPFQPEPSDIPSPPNHPTDKTSSETASAVDSHEPASGERQPFSCDSTEKKPSAGQTIPAVPLKPVSMHRTINFSSEPIDIQFGDVQWTDSVPMTVTPSDSTPVSTSLDNHGRETAAAGAFDEHEQRLE